MKSKSIAGAAERTFVLILDQGEEAFKTITDFANQQGIDFILGQELVTHRIGY